MQKVMRVLDTLINGLGIIVLCFMVIAIGMQVFFRYVLHWPLGWPEEATLFAFCWCTYLGICIVARKNGHLRLDIIPTTCPSLAPFLDRVSMLVSIGYFIFCGWQGSLMTKQIYNMAFTAVGFPLPQWVVWLIIPICSFLAAFITLTNFILSFTDKQRGAQ